MPEEVRKNLVLIPEPPGVICLLQSQCSSAGTPVFVAAAAECSAKSPG